MDTLAVYMGRSQVGRVRRLEDGELAFAYSADWRDAPEARAISPLFPLSDKEYVGPQVKAYFDNLLPEGSARDFITRALHISRGNVLGILNDFGQDTAGALVFLREGMTPDAADRYLPVGKDDLKRWLTVTHGIPLNVPDDREGGEAENHATASLSGAQDKMSIFVTPEGGFALPIGTAPSSHILKPSMPMRLDILDTAVNETLVMGLAKKIGLMVPDVRYLPDLDAALVTRFDRRITADGRMKRLHQNDLCQILGYSADRKYQSEGGPTFKDCLAAVKRYSDRPDVDETRMLEWLIFNLVVGNMDGHAKNLSLYETPEGTRLSPFYDLVCTTAYPYLSKKFAFEIGGEYRWDRMAKRHWARFAEDIAVDIKTLQEIGEKICKGVSKNLLEQANAVESVVPHDSGKKLIGEIVKQVSRGMKQIQNQLLNRGKEADVER